jgi:hypothetical protein
MFICGELFSGHCGRFIKKTYYIRIQRTAAPCLYFSVLYFLKKKATNNKAKYRISFTRKTTSLVAMK